MKLFKVEAKEPEGPLHDYLVWANNVEQAAALAIKRYSGHRDDLEIFEVSLSPPDIPIVCTPTCGALKRVLSRRPLDDDISA